VTHEGKVEVSAIALHPAKCHGVEIGSYRLVRPLGRGTSGTVFEAEHSTLGRRVAIKLHHADGGAPPARVTRSFLREARVAARVRHPNVVDVFDCGVHEGAPYLVMELVEGETLARLLAREQRLPAERAVSLLLPIVSAVAALHAAGVVHRDIKPANILLGRRGADDFAPKLGDFGLARFASATASATLPGVALGTPAYLAPELRDGSRSASELSDQYALGVVLHEVLTGSKPANGESQASSSPSELDAIIARATAADPAMRFDSVVDLGRALLPFASAEGAHRFGRDLEAKSPGRNAPTHAPFFAPGGSTATDAAHADPGPPLLRVLPDRSVVAPRDRYGGPELDDPVASSLRFRRAFGMGIIIWSTFALADIAVVHYMHAGRLAYFLAVRLSVIVIAGPIYLRLRYGPAISQAALTAADVGAYSAAAVALALLCVEYRGIVSPYVPGFCLQLLSRTGAARDEPFRRGLVVNGITVAAFFLVLVGSGLFSPRIASQLRDPSAVGTAMLYASYVLSTYVLVVFGSHLTWTLRRQVFEARNLGGYRLTRRIASGANGDVWLAHHGVLKRDVALKILRTESRDATSVARFEREVRATAELTHPNTVRIFDFGTTEDRLWYYAMELLEGETLAALVRREGPLLPSRAVHLAVQACRALAEAHARGIVHRDVKPSNLFVATMGGEGDFVKVLDFGIARFSRDRGAGDRTMTATGHIVGTPAYISPEGALSEDVDVRADVYAMGAVLYFMLTGGPPFDESEGAVALLLAHASREPERPSARRGDRLDPQLEDVVMRCLRKDPAKRYPNGGALAAALAQCEPAMAATASGLSFST
jgi:serine/threonine-protein kinase